MSAQPTDKTTERITELFRHHADSLLRLCYLYLKDLHLAEDAVSETFMKAYKNLDNFKQDSCEKTWLTRITINCCKNIMRSPAYKNYKETVVEPNEFLPDKSDCIGESENRIIISAEISKLPLKYREVILLFYYRDLKTAEIAKILKVPRTTVDYRLRQAKKLLKNILKEIYFDE